MDYLYFEFHYKGKQSLIDFKNENIRDKLNGVEGSKFMWSGYVEFNNEKKLYFQDCHFWYPIRVILDTLEEKEAFIKLSLQCKTQTFYANKVLRFLP